MSDPPSGYPPAPAVLPGEYPVGSEVGTGGGCLSVVLGAVIVSERLAVEKLGAAAGGGSKPMLGAPPVFDGDPGAMPGAVGVLAIAATAGLTSVGMVNPPPD